MDITKDISLLKGAAEDGKLELYKKIISGILDLGSKDALNLTECDKEEFYQEILRSIGNSHSSSLFEQLELLLKDSKSVKCIFTDSQMNNIIKDIINVMKTSDNEKISILCFSCLSETVAITQLENDKLEDVLGHSAEIINKKTTTLSYITVCSYLQKCFKHYENKLSSFMHIIPKLIYPPLVHNSAKVREIAEKTLDDFPKLVLYSENEEGANILLKLVKESYCKDLLQLFKEKQELYVLKIWKTIVNGFGKTLHRNLPTITPFFQVIEKGFKSQEDEICKTAFICWKSLISNFATDEAVLNDSKKLRFMLKPFRNLSKFSELVSFAVCETWWHLAWSLSHNLSSRFDEVLMPLLEFTFGKNTKTQIFLVKRGCHILLRILEQPQNNSLNRISSPKKLPQLIFPPLQVPLDLKVIVRHSKEIMSMIRVVIEMFGTLKDMTSHIDSLLKSVLFVLSSVIEDKNKESVEAVISFVNFVNDVIESRLCSPLTCLKCVDSLSKLPRFVLVSHYFHSGPRKQDILCTSLLRLLVNPYLFSTEISNKRFLMAYNRLIQAGLGESMNPLSMAHKLVNIVKQVTSQNLDAEILFEMWSGIASPLLEAIEKTQEVNQGTGLEHDFSCLYDVLLCPFENIFPVSLNQIRTKPAFRLWTNLYKTFVRCASLVSTTLPNEACEHFCTRLKNYFKDDLLKEPQYFETVCYLLQVVLESIDFTSVVAPSTPVFASPSMLLNKKKPLGNLKSFVELLSMLLTSYYSNYIENEDDIYQSCTPKAQRKGHITKAAAPLDLVKTFFENLKTGVVISSALEELAPSLSKLFAISVNKTQIGAKLEVLWNVLTSSIEMHYLGPYDTDFLTMMCPLLESCFVHPRRHIKERSRRFWFATFAPASSSLIIPESLKIVLKKSKLSLMPDEQVSSLEDCSFNPVSDSMENETINFEKPPDDVKDLFAKPLDVNLKGFKFGAKEADPKQVKDKKPNNKKSVDELPSDEFVTISSPASGSLTPKRRQCRRRKSFVPAMYNDLSQSQDTTTLGGSSESFDTSSSCEIMEFKSQEESEKLVPSSQDLNPNRDQDKNEEKISSEKAEESKEINSSVEILSSQSGIHSSEKDKPSSQETKTTENEVPFKSTKATLKRALNFSEVNDNHGQSSGDNLESSDVIVVTSSESISPQETRNDSKNLTEKMPDDREIEDSLSDLKSSTCSSEARPTRLRGRKRNPSDEVLSSQELIKNDTSSGCAIKDSEPSSKDENEAVTKRKGSEEPVSGEVHGSQKIGNKKFKANTESTSKNKTSVLPKKNGKSKQNGVASLVKKTSKVDQKNLSESHPVCTGEQSILSKSNQSCIEIVDLDDSEDIIPSSQSSGDSISSTKLPVKEMSLKNSNRTLTFDPPEDDENKMDLIENKTNTSLVKDSLCPKVSDPVAEESNECPETPTDLIQPACDDIVTEVINQVSTTKTVTTMPLKSFENLVNSDEHLNKTDNKTIKTVLSEVRMNNDEKKAFIAENKPPLYTEIYNVQTGEPVNLLDKLCVEEEKIKPAVDNVYAKTELKLSDSLENVFKEESPKTVRIKSLRSANKNTARKSFSATGNKKIPKKASKRKSMPVLNLAQKINKLDENVDSQNSDQLMSSNETDKMCENNSQPEEEPIQIDECSASMDAVKHNNEHNSVLEDINNMMPDIHEKIQSYNNEDFSCDFSLSQNMEVEQDSDKDCSLSSNKQLDKEEFYEQDVNHKDNNVEKMDIICNSNHDVSKTIKTPNGDYTFLSSEHSKADQCAHSDEKSIVTNNNLDMEGDRTEKFMEINVSSQHNIPLINENSVNDANLKTDIPADDLKALGQFTQNKVESSEVIEEGKLSVHEPENLSDETQNMDACDQGLNFKSQEDEKKWSSSDEIIVAKNNANDEVALLNNETHEMSSELAHNETAQNPQIKILGVVSMKEKYAVFENLGEGDPDSLIVDIMGSSDEAPEANHGNNACLNNIDIDETLEQESKKKISETDINSEKLKVCTTTATIKIDSNIAKNKQDSCSSEIVEIEETCDLASFANEDVTKPELNGYPSIEEPCKTDGFEENVYNELKEKEKSIETSFNETFIVEDPEPDAVKNVTIIKLTSDSKLSDEPETGLHASAQEIHDLENHCNDADSDKNYEDEKAEYNNFNSSNTSYTNSASSCSQIDHKEVEGSSRRRKPKCPVRSPFNFRQRSNLIVCMSNTLPKNNEQNSGKAASKKTASNVQNKPPENTAKKIKKHIEPKIKIVSVAPQNGNKLDAPMNNSISSQDPADQEVKKAISSAKRLKVMLHLKEMTDVNTRYNASIAPQTRRLKMLSDVHNSQPVEEDDLLLYENDSTYTIDDISGSRSSTSILKKRKASSEGSDSKLRRVTFSDPLVEERLFSNDDNLSERILRVSAQMNIVEHQNSISSDVEKVAETNIPLSDEIPSSSEYQNSDNLTDYNHLPISPLLVNCEESVSCIIKDLTSPTWAQGLMTLLLAKNIKTIGDLCKLNVHELKALPIKSPKVSCLHKALLAHLQHTQGVAASKFNSSEDWCTDTSSSENKNKENEPNLNQEDEKMDDENIGSETLESIAGVLLTNDRIGLLKRETLLALSKKCFQEVTKRLEDH